MDVRGEENQTERAFYSKETEIYFMQEGTALAKGRLAWLPAILLSLGLATIY